MLRGRGRAIIRRLLAVPVAAFRRAGGGFDVPAEVTRLPGPRVLVLAPHADDEAIGCGGTLHRHACAGHEVTPVVVTDGAAGHAFTDLRGAELVARRREEARQGAAAMGLRPPVFLDFPDGSLRADRTLVNRLAGLLQELQPQVVYVPSVFDSHPDHRQVFAAARRAMARYRADCEVWLYEVWSPLPANRVVVIDPEAKAAAIRCYRSQLDESEFYVRAMEGLGRYRAISALLGPGRVAEAFWVGSRGRFLRTFRAWS